MASVGREAIRMQGQSSGLVRLWIPGPQALKKVHAPPTNIDFTTLPFTASPVSSLELGLIEGRRRRPGYWLEITMLRYLKSISTIL
jgi:hypothetical protein